MKLARLTDARLYASLRRLSTQPLPLKIAFRLKGISAKIDMELKKFDEIRQAALEKFGKHDADGKLIVRDDGSVEFEPEMLQALAAELNEVGNEDVDVGSLKLDDLGDKVELTVDDLTILDGIIVE